MEWQCWRLELRGRPDMVAGYCVKTDGYWSSGNEVDWSVDTDEVDGSVGR